MADRNLVLQLLITARDQASAALERVGAGIQAIGGSVSQALGPLRNFGALLAATAGLGGAKELLDRAEAYTRLTNQLRVATQGEEEYQAALEAVVAVARRSNADLDSTANLYGKIAQNAETLGLSQGQVADVTELVAKAMQLSGAEASAASGAILQLGQALGSGALRGDEFNSIMEASPKLMEALAAGLGVAVGELRAMAEAGQLTADRVVKALLTQKVAIDEVYGKLPQTVGQAMTGLANAGTLFVGKLNEQTGATQSLASGLKFLAENLDAVAALMGAAFAAALAKGTVAFGQQVAAMLAAKAAARELAIAAAAQQQEAVAAAQGHLAAAQAAANRALAEQRLALQVVAAMEAELGYGVVTANLTAARQQAAAAAAAATAATQRYAAAQAALVAAQGAGTASVGLFARAMGLLTGPVGLIALAVSAFAGLYAAFSRQKPATDALTSSLDEYSAALKKATAAQLAVQALDLDRQIAAQKTALADATREWEIHKSWLDNAAESGRDVGKTQEALTRSAAALEVETQKLNELNERRNQLLQEQETRAKATASADGALIGQYTQQATAMDKLSVAIQERAKHLKTVSDAQIRETEALLAKAEAEGKVVEIDRLTVQLAAQRATQARLAAELARGEATAAMVKVAALESIERTQQRLTPQEAAALQAAREAATAKTAEAAAAEALAAQLDAQAKSAETGTEATQRLADVLEKLHAETERNIEAADRETTVRRTQIAAALELATAKGNEAEAARLSAEAAQEEVAASTERIQQLTEQQTLVERHINLLYEQANADGVYTEAERAVIEALKDKATETAQEIAGIEAKLPLLEQEAAQAERMAGPIGALIRLTEQRVAAAGREIAAIERGYDAQIREQQVIEAVANAKGDAAAAAAAAVRIKELEAEKAQAVADALAREAEAAIAAADAKKLEILASDRSIEAKNTEIAALDALIAKQRESVAAAQATAAAARAQADAAADSAAAANDASAAIRETGDATERSGNQAAEYSEALVYLAKNFDQLSERGKAALDAIGKGPDFTVLGQGVMSAWRYLELITQATQKLDEAAGAEIEFNRRLQETAALANGVGEEADRAREQLVRMAQTGATNIRGLTQDGEQAIQMLEDIKNASLEAEAALSGLAADFERQILQLRGDQRALLKLEHEDNLRRIEEEYARAGALGRDEYAAAKRRAEDLHKLKLQQIEEQDRQSRTRDTTTANNVKDAWSGAADEIERAKTALAGINSADLNNVIGQIGKVTGAAQQLRSVL